MGPSQHSCTASSTADLVFIVSQLTCFDPSSQRAMCLVSRTGRFLTFIWKPGTSAGFCECKAQMALEDAIERLRRSYPELNCANKAIVRSVLESSIEAVLILVQTATEESGPQPGQTAAFHHYGRPNTTGGGRRVRANAGTSTGVVLSAQIQRRREGERLFSAPCGQDESLGRAERMRAGQEAGHEGVVAPAGLGCAGKDGASRPR